ncbi:MAG: papain fold toxin domain-containing protein [Planktothrix sp.]|uniref:papain fold toxin domain-containing protein n=1 Tax=Planktothrix sp. TaxID=3088171 RepID=UPI0038D49050
MFLLRLIQILTWYLFNGIHLKIKLVGRGLFIVSKRWDNNQTSITQNRTHYGIEARGKVFDNLSSYPIFLLIAHVKVETRFLGMGESQKPGFLIELFVSNKDYC